MYATHLYACLKTSWAPIPSNWLTSRSASPLKIIQYPTGLLYVLKPNYKNELYYSLKNKYILCFFISPKLSLLKKVEHQTCIFSLTLLLLGWRKTIILHDIFFIMRTTKSTERNLRIFGNKNECTYFPLASSNYFTM